MPADSFADNEVAGTIFLSLINVIRISGNDASFAETTKIFIINSIVYL